MNKINNDPLVSIIMPAFNAADYISESINSVIDQSYQNWELLITDDCSSDNTREIMQSFSEKDKRIIPIYQKNNNGPAMARNSSLSMAKGELIAFLDSDDLWLQDKLKICVKTLIQENAAICFTGFRRISANGERLGHYISVPKHTNYKKLLGGNVIATSTVLINKNIVGEFRMKKTFYDDFDCWLQILKLNKAAIGINEDLMRYRVLDGSISRNKLRSSMEVWKALRDLEKITIFPAIFFFISYAIKGYLKYRKF